MIRNIEFASEYKQNDTYKTGQLFMIKAKENCTYKPPSKAIVGLHVLFIAKETTGKYCASMVSLHTGIASWYTSQYNTPEMTTKQIASGLIGGNCIAVPVNIENVKLVQTAMEIPAP